MSESDPFNPADWPESWMDAQRRYWDAWLNLSRAAAEGTKGTEPKARPSEAPWAGALDQWWRSMSGTATPDARDFFERMMNLSRGYFTMAEGLMHQGGEHAATDALKSWLDQMTTALRQMSASGAGQDQHFKDFKSFWQLPMDTWQRVASSIAPMPGDMWRALRPEGAPAFGPDMRGHLDQFLSLPGVGYARESQEQYQSLWRRVMEYQQAQQAYEAGIAKVALDSADRFRARLDDASRRQDPITTLRALFNEWVDVCEEVYGEYAMSEEYARTYGEMVNALMAVKQEGSLLVDETLEAMNMPTRREISTLHQRFQESRREIRELRREIEALKSSNNGNDRVAAPDPKPAPSPKKAARKAAPAKQPKPSGAKRRTNTKRS